MLTGKMNDIYVSEAHPCPTVNGGAGPGCAIPIEDLSTAPKPGELQ